MYLNYERKIKDDVDKKACSSNSNSETNRLTPLTLNQQNR